MKFGYSIPGNQGFDDVHALVDLARQAEGLGFDSVWASEHLFHASYIAERLDNRPYWEALTLLTAVASATSRVRLGTSVLVLPWHDPARLGKTVATLDHLSDGRVTLGVGVATTKDEFENLGVDFHTRGARTDEVIQALKALWTQEVPAFDGAFYRYSGLKFSPKPKQSPHPPIVIGGGSQAALRRTARHGDGWHALRKTPAEVRQAAAELARLAEAEGRDPAGLAISISLPITFDSEPSARAPEDRSALKGGAQDVAETLAAYAEAGVGEVVLTHASRDKAAHEATLRRVADAVRPLLA